MVDIHEEGRDKAKQIVYSRVVPRINRPRTSSKATEDNGERVENASGTSTCGTRDFGFFECLEGESMRRMQFSPYCSDHKFTDQIDRKPAVTRVNTRTMKYLAAVALPAIVPVSGYMGGFNYGRPMGSYVSPEQAERFRRTQQQVDKAFADLASEFGPDRCSSPGCGEGDLRSSEDAVRQQREWLNRAFGVAVDVASGFASPFYRIQDEDDSFQVSLDVPGVRASDIDISVDERDGKILTVRGERDVEGSSGIESSSSSPRTSKFVKSFVLDPATDTDKITARISNGVLTVSAPKDVKKAEKKTKKIPVELGADEDIPIRGSKESNDEIDDNPDSPGIIIN